MVNNQTIREFRKATTNVGKATRIQSGQSIDKLPVQRVNEEEDEEDAQARRYSGNLFSG